MSALLIVEATVQPPDDAGRLMRPLQFTFPDRCTCPYARPPPQLVVLITGNNGYTWCVLPPGTLRARSCMRYCRLDRNACSPSSLFVAGGTRCTVSSSTGSCNWRARYVFGSGREGPPAARWRSVSIQCPAC